MAKKDKNKENKVSTDESTGSKIVTVLIVLVIVVIWLAIFGVLIKLDVGNFGSEVLYPVLKDVPVVNMILPEPAQKRRTRNECEIFKGRAGYGLPVRRPHQRGNPCGAERDCPRYPGRADKGDCPTHHKPAGTDT